MQIKEIRWIEDKENNIILGSIENYDLFEIENIDNVIILTNITAFDITYPATIEEAKKNAQELLNKFINKMILQATFTTDKKGIETAFVKFDKDGKSYKKVWEVKQPEKKKFDEKSDKRVILNKKEVKLKTTKIPYSKDCVNIPGGKVNTKIKSNDRFEITEVILNKKEWLDVSTNGKKRKKNSNGGYLIPNTEAGRYLVDAIKQEAAKQPNSNDNWKKQKRDSKGRFIPKKGK